MNDSLMIDLETFGNGNDAAIIAIGACMFDPHGTEIGDTFYKVVDLEISSHPGDIDSSTVMWWLKQNSAARAALTDPQRTEPLGRALTLFAEFAELHKAKTIWSNGPTFDEVILNSAYRRYGMKPPIPFRGSRCMRTVRSLPGAPRLFMSNDEVAHNALDDAIHQAKHVQLIYKELFLS